MVPTGAVQVGVVYCGGGGGGGVRGALHLGDAAYFKAF
jgi:hypothetical protein